MEISENLERPKTTEEEKGIGLGVNGSETKISDITSPPLLSKKGVESLRQVSRKLEESANLELEDRKEIGANVEIPEKPTPNLMIRLEKDENTLEPTSDNLRPEYKELEADKKQEVTSESWMKKAWGKVAFSSPDNLYFKPNIIEKWENGRIYEMLGVRNFQRLYDWVLTKRVLGYHSTFHVIMKAQNRKSALKDFEKDTRMLESLHVAAVPIFEIFAAGAFYNEGPISGYIFTAVNFALNFYPIITQRYSRVKAYNLIDKLNVREKNNK